MPLVLLLLFLLLGTSLSFVWLWPVAALVFFCLFFFLCMAVWIWALAALGFGEDRSRGHLLGPIADPNELYPSDKPLQVTVRFVQDDEAPDHEIQDESVAQPELDSRWMPWHGSMAEWKASAKS